MNSVKYYLKKIEQSYAESPRMDITIYHCTSWGYGPRAASLAASIKKELGISAKLRPGRAGQFEVFIEGELVIGKEQVGFLQKLLGNKGIPADEKVITLLKARQTGESNRSDWDALQGAARVNTLSTNRKKLQAPVKLHPAAKTRSMSVISGVWPVSENSV